MQNWFVHGAKKLNYTPSPFDPFFRSLVLSRITFQPSGSTVIAPLEP